MRELGIGDLSVPRNVKRAAAALMDRFRTYGRMLELHDRAGLERALDEHIFMGRAGRQGVAELAAYVLQAREHLNAQSGARLLAGEVHFPSNP
jgi:cytochrome b pre-mRNA-processing protein 3